MHVDRARMQFHFGDLPHFVPLTKLLRLKRGSPNHVLILGVRRGHSRWKRDQLIRYTSPPGSIRGLCRLLVAPTHTVVQNDSDRHVGYIFDGVRSCNTLHQHTTRARRCVTGAVLSSRRRLYRRQGVIRILQQLCPKML